MKKTKHIDRNTNLDLIRFIGVLLIMIAHSNPPDWLFQLRNFGTPFLILGSALTYAYIYKDRAIINKTFFKKRLKRLVLPLWIFLSFFFLFFEIISPLTDKSTPFRSQQIKDSYYMYNGIGFVWIFKVYIILALITPISLKISKSTLSNKKYFTSIIITYLVYEIGMQLFFDLIPTRKIEFITQYFLIIIPYSVIYLYGLRLHLIKRKDLYINILISLFIFISLAISKYNINNEFVPTQEYKYPPTLYYLSYAFFCMNLIYLLITRSTISTNLKTKQIITWLSTYSLWIYLWHILAHYIWVIYIINDNNSNPDIMTRFIFKTLFLLLFGITMTYIQTTLINKALLKNNQKYKNLLLLLK